MSAAMSTGERRACCVRAASCWLPYALRWKPACMGRRDFVIQAELDPATRVIKLDAEPDAVNAVHFLSSSTPRINLANCELWVACELLRVACVVLFQAVNKH